MTDGYGLILLCAGSGQRSGLAYNKVFHMFGRLTALEMCLQKFAGAKYIVIAARDEDKKTVQALAKAYNPIVVSGGKTRFESVSLALSAMPECGLVAVHDCARPFVSEACIERCLQSAHLHGSGVAAIPASDTLVQARSGLIENTFDRSTMFHIQTPQVFDFQELTQAYSDAVGEDFTDDSAVYLAAGHSVRLAEGERSNIKITTPSDFFPAGEYRTGIGYDVHALSAGRKLILGGVHIPYPLGLLGHSDADVLIHAVMDALLSACGLSDIGCYFPDTSPEFKDISSISLLERVRDILSGAGYSIENISACVICEKPRLSPHIPDMKTALAHALKIDAAKLSISATTAERLGLIGEGKGIAASATCLVRHNTKHRKQTKYPSASFSP